MDAKQRIARRVAQELRDGDIVNLGIGLPTMVANYLSQYNWRSTVTGMLLC